MKRFLAFAAFAALLSGAFLSCSDGVQEENASTGADCGSLGLRLAVPRFMAPDSDGGTRMIMPSTRIIKFKIYSSAARTGTPAYSKEFEVENSTVAYSEAFCFVAAQLDDVPVGTYPEGVMKVELYDSKNNLLTEGTDENSGGTTVEANSSGNPATVSFYTLPPANDVSEISEDDFDGNGEYKADVDAASDVVSGYDIYYQVYKVNAPSDHDVSVWLSARNSTGKDVALVVYDENGAATDDCIQVTSETSVDIGFSGLLMSGGTYYVVMYTKGPLSEGSTLKFVCD